MSVTQTWRGQQHTQQVRAAVVSAMEDTMRAAAEETRAHTPVRTGHLRDSMRYLVQRQGDRVHGEFGSMAGPNYAIFIEIGTRSIRGRFMIRRAADRILPTFGARLRARLP